MTYSRSLALAALALLMASRGNSGTQKIDVLPTSAQKPLSLNGKNAGQHLAATVGQRIQITLQTIGPGRYNTPEISSPAIRFEGFADPTAQNPGGPTQVYCFEAAAEGEAQVKIPHTALPSSFRVPTFTLTIRVTKGRSPGSSVKKSP
jgi:hypothetical protein